MKYHYRCAIMAKKVFYGEELCGILQTAVIKNIYMMKGKEDNEGGPKHLLFRKGKPVIVSTNLALQNDGENILSISEAFQLFISKKKNGR
jgi:hypothetical protein